VLIRLVIELPEKADGKTGSGFPTVAVEGAEPAQNVLRCAKDDPHYADLGLALCHILLVDAERVDPDTASAVREPERVQRRGKAAANAEHSFIRPIEAFDECGGCRIAPHI
jgi:hypothetical protein